MHNSVNELTARTIGQGPQVALSYDDAGNLTQDGSADGDHQYVWDYRNRLIEVKEKQSGNWNTVGEYKYDARTRRVLKIVLNKGTLNGVTAFVWGGDSDWQCVEERSGAGDLVARYTYSPGYIDAVAVQERDLNADDDFGDANEVVYYHSNTLFSTYALSNANEEVVERYRLDMYGGISVLDPDWSSDADGLSDFMNPCSFTGRRDDSESDLMQFRHRTFSAALGRFLSRDPLVGAAPYVYADGKPTRSSDPSGLKPMCCYNWGQKWQENPQWGDADDCALATMEHRADDWSAWTDWLVFGSIASAGGFVAESGIIVNGGLGGGAGSATVGAGAGETIGGIAAIEGVGTAGIGAFAGFETGLWALSQDFWIRYSTAKLFCMTKRCLHPVRPMWKRNSAICRFFGGADDKAFCPEGDLYDDESEVQKPLSFGEIVQSGALVGMPQPF